MKKFLIFLVLLFLVGCSRKYDKVHLIKIGDDTYYNVTNVVITDKKISFYENDTYFEIINPESVVVIIK